MHQLVASRRFAQAREHHRIQLVDKTATLYIRVILQQIRMPWRELIIAWRNQRRHRTAEIKLHPETFVVLNCHSTWQRWEGFDLTEHISRMIEFIPQLRRGQQNLLPLHGQASKTALFPPMKLDIRLAREIFKSLASWYGTYSNLNRTQV